MKERKSLLSSLVAYSIDSHQEDPLITEDECKLLSKIILGIRHLRTSGSVYDASLLLQSKYGVYLGRTSKIWDNVGVHAVVEAAGGLYTDFFGKLITYDNPLKRANENFTWCAAHPKLHKEIQKIIHR